MERLEPTVISMAPFSRGPCDQLGSRHGDVGLISDGRSRRVSEESSGRCDGAKCGGKGAKSEQFETSCSAVRGFSCSYTKVRRPPVPSVARVLSSMGQQVNEVTLTPDSA